MTSSVATATRKPRYFAPIEYTTRFPALDGIRALAVSMVFLLHYGGGAHQGRALQVFNIVRNRLGIGVDIFLVLSGFLITGILYDTRRDSHFFKRFYVRRSVRIFPVYYLLFAVLGLLTPIMQYQWRWKHAWFAVYLGNFFANADFSLYNIPSLRYPHLVAVIGHLWSLCVEEQFYLLWPLVVWLVRDRVKLLWLCFTVAGLTLLLRVWVVLTWSPEMAERWTMRALPFRADGLLLGAALALLLRGKNADKVQRACKWLLLAGFAVMVSIWALSPAYDSPWTLSVGQSAVAIFSMGLIGTTLRQGSVANRLFSVHAARVLGKYSYGFYVWHLVWYLGWTQALSVISGWFHSSLIGGLITLPLGFATSFVIAKLSYDLFEVRFLGIKRRYEYDTELRQHKTAFAADGN